MTSTAIVVGAILVASVIAVWFGERTWRRASDAAFAQVASRADSAARGDSATRSGRARSFAPQSLDGLPAPVARYFRLVLIPGMRMVRLAYIDHAGDFALEPNDWKPFTSRQLYSTAPRAFVWDAAIRMFPLVPVRVRDAYRDGRGSTLGAIGGTVTMVDQAGTPALARAALLRYLAESAWLPTALLPSEGVQWTAIDDSTAQATVADAKVEVSMDVHFAPTGEIARITALRERDVNGTPVLTPWVGEFSHELLSVGGMKIPVSAAVKWVLPEGEHVYWRGKVRGVRYDFR
ncbi:MAG: hypothetical protein IT359_16420 [Gemmatimonadaceae bacterium]|nr:hypothetical protein [Gemmatimonadaceae bacterium]